MHVLLTRVFTVSLGLTLADCGTGTAPPAPDAPQPAAAAPAAAAAPEAAKPGAVMLSAIDERGQGLPGVTFNVYGTSMAGERVTMEIAGDANGKASQRVPEGLYKVSARVALDYNGQAYRLDLHPAGDVELPNADSADGITRAFVWKPTGPNPGTSPTSTNPFMFYGNCIEVDVTGTGEGQFNIVPPLPEGEYIELTMEPDGPLMDGTAGKTLTLKLSNNYGESFIDQPPGKYTAKARLVSANGSVRPLRLAWRPDAESVISPTREEATDSITVQSQASPGKWAEGLAAMRIFIWY